MIVCRSGAPASTVLTRSAFGEGNDLRAVGPGDGSHLFGFELSGIAVPRLAFHLPRFCSARKGLARQLGEKARDPIACRYQPG